MGVPGVAADTLISCRNLCESTLGCIGVQWRVASKEDRAEVTLGILIKIPPNLLLDRSPITFGRIKMFSKFIFLCLQNMVSGQQVEYINLLRPSHPQDLHIGQDLK